MKPDPFSAFAIQDSMQYNSPTTFSFHSISCMGKHLLSRVFLMQLFQADHSVSLHFWIDLWQGLLLNVTEFASGALQYNTPSTFTESTWLTDSLYSLTWPAPKHTLNWTDTLVCKRKCMYFHQDVCRIGPVDKYLIAGFLINSTLAVIRFFTKQLSAEGRGGRRGWLTVIRTHENRTLVQLVMVVVVARTK